MVCMRKVRMVTEGLDFLCHRKYAAYQLKCPIAIGQYSSDLNYFLATQFKDVLLLHNPHRKDDC